jgi:hypothetical protein
MDTTEFALEPLEQRLELGFWGDLWKGIKRFFGSTEGQKTIGKVIEGLFKWLFG